MKTIHFVQAGILYGSTTYFPYASGCVAAHAWNNPLISESYRLGHFIFLRQPIAEVVAGLEEPFMVVFSNYVWNIEYHKALAKAVKERWPDCFVLFGGHQILNGSSEQLNEYPFVDFLIHKAGEIPFEKLLLALLSDVDFSEVPSLSYRGASGMPVRSQALPCPGEGGECCEFPSPYLEGIFDRLVAAHPEIHFSMTIETNRGCPYSCAYCDWGADRGKFLLIPMERVKAEIDWAARHKIEYVNCADGNFGVLERDEEIADYLVETKRCEGFPEKFNACYAKNSNETVFRLNQKLCTCGMNVGATVSFQTLSPAALENIGRKNLPFEKFQELIALYNQAGIPVYSDIMVGLPGETLVSFTKGIGRLLAAGMHGSLEIFAFEVFPNAEMADPAYREKYGIESVRVRRYTKYSSPENMDEIPEYIDLVRQTATMPERDWIASHLFSNVVQGFHCMGLLQYLAVYLYSERGLPYERFYLELMDYAKNKPGTLVGELIPLFEGHYRALAGGRGEGWVYYDPRFGELLWPLGSALFLRSAFEAERLYEELPGFLERYDIDAGVLSELIRFQHTMVRLPCAPPPRQSFRYDFPGYFSAIFAGQEVALQEKQTALVFTGQSQSSSWPDFARERVWYGRRSGLIIKEYEIDYG